MAKRAGVPDSSPQRLVMREPLADESIQTRDVDLELAHLARDVQHVRRGLFTGNSTHLD